MYFRILGSGAGGGLPQWNCRCTNCTLARNQSPRVRPRTQCSAAVSADRKHWFLLNASPDIRTQLAEFLCSDEPHVPVRKNPFEGILLSDADLDHTLGLLILREGSALNVHCSAAMREDLIGGLGVERVLSQYAGVRWHDAPQTDEPLHTEDGAQSGLTCRAVALEGSGPRYARGSARPRESRIAWVIVDRKSGSRLVHCPAVRAMDETLLKELEAADLVTFDGTFYRDDEMRHSGAGTVRAAEMEHLPIEESLPLLSPLRARVFYTHINNTNPIARDDSDEARAVARSGVGIAFDGLETEV